jgi:hypothetical protein
MKVELSQNPIRDDVFIVEDCGRWIDPAYKAAIPFADVFDEALDAEVQHLPVFVYD